MMLSRFTFAVPVRRPLPGAAVENTRPAGHVQPLKAFCAARNDCRVGYLD